MKGQVSSEVEIKAPAAAIWEVYKGLQLGHLVNKLLSDVIGTTQVIQGDGGVGTIVKVTFAPQVAAASGGPTYMTEIYRVADNEKKIKETELIEGGFKELGFEMYRFRIEIIEKHDHLDTSDAEGSSCIIKSSILYELRDEDSSKADLVSTEPLDIMATVIGNYVATEHHNSSSAKA